LRIEYAEVSLLGNRTDNQDRVSVAVSEHSALLVVIDGMGGHSDGAKAAETAIKTLVEAFWHTPQPILDPLGFLHLSLGRAHDRVVKLGDGVALDHKPRATCAVCLVQDGGSYWAHVGDSRIYQLRAGAIKMRTRDHSHIELLLREGLIAESEMRSHPMRNFVECCLGGEPFLPEMTLGLREPLEANDILLVCSDGLWGGLDDNEIGGAFPPARAALKDELVRLAERSVNVVGAGSDNTSAAIVRWIGNA
jgi:serine/threonine protein phosphatase PrpC